MAVDTLIPEGGGFRLPFSGLPAVCRLTKLPDKPNCTGKRIVGNMIGNSKTVRLQRVAEGGEVPRQERPRTSAPSRLSPAGPGTRLVVKPHLEVPEALLASEEHPMPEKSRQAGFTFLELLIVVAMGLVIASFAVPTYQRAMRNFRIKGDAEAINAEILLAKMRAAANFTRGRVKFHLTQRTFVTEKWDKTGGSWVQVSVGGPLRLSAGVNYGFGNQTSPPAGSQATLSQPPTCKAGTLAGGPGAGADQANTACIVFNSRGYPVDNSGVITANYAIYIADGASTGSVPVEGVSVSMTGLTNIWRHDPTSTTVAGWYRR